MRSGCTTEFDTKLALGGRRTDDLRRDRLRSSDIAKLAANCEFTLSPRSGKIVSYGLDSRRVLSITPPTDVRLALLRRYSHGNWRCSELLRYARSTSVMAGLKVSESRFPLLSLATSPVDLKNVVVGVEPPPSMLQALPASLVPSGSIG
jgi:hypothetical protein